MKKPFISCLVGSALSFNLIASVKAAENEPLTIVITGTRTAQTVDESLAPVSVITRRQIDNSNATTIDQLLNTTPGLYLTTNGSTGSNTSIFLRGTESDHALVLVDGVRMSSATSGTASIQNIPLSQIERIEIVRGPRSSLYGSDAIGGVIQIFTRKPSSGHQSNVSLATGSHASQGLNAGFANRSANTWIGTQVSTFKTDGFDACRAEAATQFGGCFADEPDADGYQNKALSITGGVSFSSNVEASFNLLRIDSKLDFDGSFSNSSESINQLIGTKLNVSVNENWDIALTAARNKDYLDDFNQGVFSSTFNTDRDQFGIQNDVFVGTTGLITFGLDHYNDKVSSTTDFDIKARDNTGLFAQYQGKIGLHDFQFSLRNDDNQQFGNQVTGGINVGHNIGQNFRLTAAYGTAFKAPSFNELYFPNSGNAELSIETAKSLDLGLAWKGKTTHFSSNFFDTKIDNLITFDAVTFTPVNIEKAHIQGIELIIGTQLAGWNLNAIMTYLSPKNDGASAKKDKLLARRPQQILDIDISRRWNAFNLGLNLHQQSESFDDLANTKRLDGFTTVGAKLAYKINPSWSLDIALNNLLDEQYETAQFFNQDGINGLMNLRYTGK